MIKNSKLARKCGQYRQLVGREVVHDFMGPVYVPLLLVVALDETLHVCDAPIALLSAKYLQVHPGEMVIGVGVKLPLKLRKRLDGYYLAADTGVRFVSGEAVDPGVERLQASEHVIEGSPAHHQHD